MTLCTNTEQSGKRMDKVALNNDDMNCLLEWRDKNQDLVRTTTCPLKKVKIVAVEVGITLTCIRSERELTVSITQQGKSKGKMVFEILPFGIYRLVKSSTSIYGKDDVQSVVTVYASLMALLSFGGDTEKESRQTKSGKKNKSSKKPSKTRKTKGITYILKRSGNEAHIVKQGSHKSPQGTFTVRGHFRHYKSGKVVWIEEYSKGSGRKKNKTYKL